LEIFRMSALPQLIVILGPTASAKSTLGIRLAQQLGGEIVACDSTQVYREFDIGTAKIPLAEQHGIPHHLVDLVEPQEIFTAGEYRRRALIVLEDLRRRGKVPILTAGSGLYLRALLEGLSDAPLRSEELRNRLRRKSELRGPGHLHRILTRLDAATAARIAPRDTQKVIRAIEMCVLARKPVAEIHSSGRSGLAGYQIIRIGLLPARAALYTRIDLRVEAMLRAGWIEEVRQLIARGIPADAKPFQFIGYAQLRAHLGAGLGREEAQKQIQQATRRFAKRQITWFRKESGVHWLSGFGDAPETAAAALQCLQSESP
jgi:tRNA dimethylallyltransferase